MIFDKHPLPWHIDTDSSITFVYDANNKMVPLYTNATDIIDIINTKHQIVPTVKLAKPAGFVWVVKEPNGLFLRNAQKNSWTYDIGIARKFKRRSDATNCINRASLGEAEPQKYEIF